MILQNYLDEHSESVDLRELISRSFVHNERQSQESPNFSFSRERNKSEEVLEFPPVQRVVTLNDLAPSTQRHLTATPPSLPPRTPKSKAKSGNQHSEIPENNFFTFTPTEERKRERKPQY